MKYIELKGKKHPGLLAVVDDEDYERVNALNWFAASDGYNMYAVRTYWDNGKFRKMRMHRFVINAPSGMEVDHREGNGLDNRKHMLRICTHAENMRNRKLVSTNTSGYMGVQKSGNKWAATIGHDGALLNLGAFGNPRHAALVRDLFAREIYGEFAKLNLTPAQ